ncbi:hypothetical protein DDV96_03375 [Marixanthomonas spongiae]|uniref:Uncharacterized protein n=2 Tax=Marixanthomonas spongiae TaxID=2174845 RepID=A0A2U0I5D3_9FLAO|nr:hypothetical protein DDV96_03375 [Marixanthomonas spongiae]
MFTSCAQKLTCADFKNGEFYVPADEETPFNYKIIRKGNKQIEILLDPENKIADDFNKKAYEIIEWIDDCTYRLKYDENRMKITKNQQFINDNNGILTELIKIEGTCYYYKSTLNVNREIERIDGRICIE